MLQDPGRQGQSRPSCRAGTEMLAMAAPDMARDIDPMAGNLISRIATRVSYRTGRSVCAGYAHGLVRRSADVRICRNEVVAFPYAYALACMPLTVAAIVNSALRFILGWAVAGSARLASVLAGTWPRRPFSYWLLCFDPPGRLSAYRLAPRDRRDRGGGT